MVSLAVGGSTVLPITGGKSDRATSALGECIPRGNDAAADTLPDAIDESSESDSSGSDGAQSPPQSSSDDGFEGDRSDQSPEKEVSRDRPGETRSVRFE